jgi:uncharacterized protein YhaN
VKIQNLHIDGFGRINQTSYALAPGLNVIGGPNEAGKSTLQQAVLALLYGFFGGSRRTPAEVETLEHYRPWDGATYGGQLEYTLDCGGAFRIARCIDGGHVKTTIVDAQTGADLSQSFSVDRLGNLDVALKHFGILRDVFVHTNFIRLAELGPLAEIAAEVADTITDSTGQHRRNRAVVQAEELLRKALTQDIGSELSSNTPLAISDERQHELIIEKTLIQLKYRNLAEDFVTRRRQGGMLAEWMAARDELKYHLTLTRLTTVTFRVREIEKLTIAETALREQLADLQNAADFPARSREVVAGYAQEHRTLSERLARLEGMAAPARAHVAELQDTAARVREQLRRLESSRSVPVEHEATVRELEHALPQVINAHQSKEAELAAVRQAIAALEPARIAGARRSNLVSAGPGKMSELRVRWEAMQKQIAAAEHEHAQVDAAWRKQGLSEADYAELSRKVSASSPDDIGELTAMWQFADRSQKLVAANWKSRAIRPVAIVGVTLALIGITLIGGTALDYETNWLREGLAFLLAGALASLLVRGLRFLVQRDLQAVERQSAGLKQRLADRGFASVPELEAARQRQEQAQPLHVAWLGSRQALDAAFRDCDALRAELLSLLELPAAAEISSEQLTGLEQYLRDLREDLKELDRLEQQQAQLASELQFRREAMQRVVDDTRAILKAAGLVELNLLADLRSFLVMCENRKELDKVEAQLKDLEAGLTPRLESTLTIESDIRTERSKLTDLEEEMRLVLAKAGIAAAGVAEGLKLYNQRSEQAERFLRIQGILQSLERECKALLRSFTLEQLKKQAEIFGQTVNNLLVAYPALADQKSERSEESLQESLFEIQHRINTVNHALSAVEARLQAGTAGYRSLAEVEEEIVREQARMEHLAFDGRALNVALDLLAAASDDYHRNFLPRLNHLMAASLKRVTGGHYSRVQIERSDLRVRVEVPEVQQLMSPEQLSQGIQDQIYLLLRFGLAEMMSEGRESLPFLLDDPFVNYDHSHLMLTLNMLAKVAEHSQLLLFTKDEVIVDWFKGSRFDPALHRLHELGESFVSSHPYRMTASTPDRTPV